jgi:nitroreductase
LIYPAGHLLSMGAIDAVLTRRSIRKYTADTIPEVVVLEIIKVAMAAPSAGNEQPWHFIMIKDRTILAEIPKFQPYSAMVKEAPVAILICGGLSEEKHKGFWVQDCAAATKNLLIAARAKELGAVWRESIPGRIGSSLIEYTWMDGDTQPLFRGTHGMGRFCRVQFG